MGVQGAKPLAGGLGVSPQNLPFFYTYEGDNMKRVLEDMFMGPMTSPSFTSGLRFRWEDSRRRVRAIFNGVTIADSKRVMLMHEAGHLPVFYFPMEDVRLHVLQATQHTTHSPLQGHASY